ncbi:MAG: YgfZ/GcvT domain-containing protein [Hyphomicrobiaceae bacterium]
MSHRLIARFGSRGIVAVRGPDARMLLDRLITNDMDLLASPAAALHAALLTPQGKILAAFFVVQVDDGFLLVLEAGEASELIRRLSLYKLRAAVTLDDWTSNFTAFAIWSGPHLEAVALQDRVIFPDPRNTALGMIALVAADKANADGHAAIDPSGVLVDPSAYDDNRIALGIGAAVRDYALGDTFPHEANFDLTGSADFKKGCFVGQEVVSRMQHKTVVRKRITPVATADGVLVEGDELRVGEAVIGTLGSISTDGRQALAKVRLDRALEAVERGIALTTTGMVTVSVEPQMLALYRAQVIAKSA